MGDRDRTSFISSTAPWVVAFTLFATACSPGVAPVSTTSRSQPPTTPTTTTLPPTPTSSTPPTPTSSTPPTTVRPTAPLPVHIDENGFNDHTVPGLASVGEFFALARTGFSGQSVTKFTIADLPGDTAVHWMDSNFYTLHDEWFWFRLLNGAEVPSAPFPAQPRGPFATVADVYAWAESQPRSALPYDLEFLPSQTVGSRLYSDTFYDLALNVEPRVFGLGSLIHFPESVDGGDRWVMELEYQHDPTAGEISRFIDVIAAATPPEIGNRLEWVVRSPEQETLARQMEKGALPGHDRIVRFSDLVAPGTVSVYNEGIAAGRLLLVGPGGKDITDAGPDDIVLVENVPDWLPPARALVSSSPQTPLAHVNLLARNRGIPNASQSGLLEDPGIRQAARVRAPAIVRASRDAGLEIVLITNEQYAAWRTLNDPGSISVPAIDIGAQPLVVDLADITLIDSESDLARWRRVIGGKASGFLTMMAAGSVTMPEHPMAITVRPYFEHLAQGRTALDAMLGNVSFRSSVRTRYLLLEGPEDFEELYTEPVDAAFAQSFTAQHPPGTPIGDILEAGGFQDYLRDFAIAPATLDELLTELDTQYDYAPQQGLRFRSSSTVEDIEGFNGAGLYDSNTGFFDPAFAEDEDDRNKTIERAIKKTWASYWGFEAFEERRREGVDHVSGGMGILVHARFDDPLELGNGVMTFTILPDNAVDSLVLTINVQDGDRDVTNPETGELPEQIVATMDRAGRLRIERIASSNLVEPGVEVIDDDQVKTLFDQARSIALLWRERVNAALPAAQDITTLTLDYEFKEMAAGWPATTGGSFKPARLVVKQARTLEPSLRGVPPNVRAMPVPRDVLARARLVRSTTCLGDATTIEIFTDPLLVPDVGYNENPFVVGQPRNAGAQGCTTRVLFSTPDQFLIELLTAGDLLNISA